MQAAGLAGFTTQEALCSTSASLSPRLPPLSLLRLNLFVICTPAVALQEPAALDTSLQSVYQILLARGTLRQKRSRPFRAQIDAYSPKASLVLPGPIVNGQQLPLCTVSLTQLSCKMLAGSQSARQLHSGAGAVFMQVKSDLVTAT